MSDLGVLSLLPGFRDLYFGQTQVQVLVQVYRVEDLSLELAFGYSLVFRSLIKVRLGKMSLAICSRFSFVRLGLEVKSNFSSICHRITELVALSVAQSTQPAVSQSDFAQ